MEDEKMTERQFEMAAEYANKQLKDWQVAEALDFLNNRMPIPDGTYAILYDAMEEWCDDNGLPEGAWMEWGDIEDVFFAWDEDNSWLMRYKDVTWDARDLEQCKQAAGIIGNEYGEDVLNNLYLAGYFGNLMIDK